MSREERGLAQRYRVTVDGNAIGDAMPQNHALSIAKWLHGSIGQLEVLMRVEAKT